MKTISTFLMCYGLSCMTFLYSQSISYQKSSNTFKVIGLPKLKKVANDKAKWGTYFWEFGDGHYKITDKNSIKYSGTASTEIRNISVFAVPHYTVVRSPIEIKEMITIRKTKTDPLYNMDKRMVYIESSANNELVPGHPVRFVIHYKAPAGRNSENGHLILFYNNTAEKQELLNVSFDPFKLIGDYAFYSNEKLAKNQNQIPKGNTGSITFGDLKNNHEDKLIIETGGMNAGEERRVFLTLKSDTKLKNHTGDKNHVLSVTALWVPVSGKFDPDSYQFSYDMQLLKVHDPNNIKVEEKVAYFKKGKKRYLTYRVNFQNEEKGITRDAKIDVLLGDALDKKSIEVMEVGAAGNKKIWKMNCTEEQIKEKKEKCFEEVKSTSSDSLSFYFRNIDLLGPSFFNKRRSKGFVKFKVMTNGEDRVNKTKSRVRISLDSSQWVTTNWAETKWRERGLFVTSGAHFNAHFSNYQSTVEKLTDRLALGLWYQNAPIGMGLSWGFALNYSAFRIERDTHTTIFNSLVPNGGYLSQSENIKLNLAEAQLHVGYQFGKIFKIYATSGITVPVASKLQLGAKVQRTLEGAEIIGDRVNSVIGLFGENVDPIIFNKTIETHSFVGYVGSIGIELGSLNKFVVGLKNEYRYYPQFYYTDHGCFKMSNLEVYIRFKLFTL